MKNKFVQTGVSLSPYSGTYPLAAPLPFGVVPSQLKGEKVKKVVKKPYLKKKI